MAIAGEIDPFVVLEFFVMGWTAPDGIDVPSLRSLATRAEEPSEMEIIRIGLDTSKLSFQVHGIDAAGGAPLRRRLSRGQVEQVFGALAPTTVGLEACGSSHYWARTLVRLGHEVRLVPPQYVKPYVKRSKTDAADAEAICEAMDRPGMRFVPVKSPDQQAAAMSLKVRALLVKQRTMAINAVRGHLAEFGVVGAKGGKLDLLMTRARPELPALAAQMLDTLMATLSGLEAQLAEVDAMLLRQHRQSEVSQRLAAVPGVGPITALTVVARTPDPHAFRSARHFAAALGLTPREHSTGGKQRLGAITRAGDPELRRLLVLGATAVLRQARQRGSGDPWLMDLLARRPPKVVAVALANKTARRLWAMMTRGEPYRAP